MKTDIEVVRGTTNTFNVVVTDADGKLYELRSGEKLLFGVKKNHDDAEYIFVKEVTSSTNGVYVVEIKPEDTEECECEHYCYDVAIQSGTDFFNVIEASAFCVCKNVTKWGCS